MDGNNLLIAVLFGVPLMMGIFYQGLTLAGVDKSYVPHLTFLLTLGMIAFLYYQISKNKDDKK